MVVSSLSLIYHNNSYFPSHLGLNQVLHFSFVATEYLLIVSSFLLILQDTFLGEILGAVFLADHSKLNPTVQIKPITILTGNLRQDGQIRVDKTNGKLVHVVENLDSEAYYNQFAYLLGNKRQSAVIGSFEEQKKLWSTPPK